jgi:hypothetical protein
MGDLQDISLPLNQKPSWNVAIDLVQVIVTGIIGEISIRAVAGLDL